MCFSCLTVNFGSLCSQSKMDVKDLTEGTWLSEGWGGSCAADSAVFLLPWQAVEGGIAKRIDEFIGKLKDLKHMASPFTLVS